MILARLLVTLGIVVPAKAAVGAAKLSFGTGYRMGRIVGFGRLAVLVAGVGIGLLLAPVPGRDLRDRLRREWRARFGEPEPYQPKPDQPAPEGTVSAAAGPVPEPRSPGTTEPS